jgi:Caspase domain
MTTSRIPDPARSHALIIGASEYSEGSGYPSLPTAGNSARMMAGLIAAREIWGLPPQNVTLLDGRVTARQVGDAIAQAADTSGMDRLFVYICAHGRIFTEDHVPDKKLHFAFADSHHDWAYTHLPFNSVRRMLVARPRAATMLVIDSCYSADAYLGADPDPAPVVPGVCTLVATRYPHQRAIATVPDSGFTAYSGALIDIMQRGIPGPDEFLTAELVTAGLARRLKMSGHPEPGMRRDETSAGLFVCMNKACERDENASAVEELRAMLDRAATVDCRAFAAKLGAIRQASRGDADKIVAAFGERRPVDDVVELAGELRTHGTTELDWCADQLLARVCECRPATDVLWLLHRHDVFRVGADGLLALLPKQEQPEYVLADVSAGLRQTPCRDCTALGADLDASMSASWPEDRQTRLYSLLY